VRRGPQASFGNPVPTLERHTPDDVSFASQRAGENASRTIDLECGVRMVWPDHCVHGTVSAAIVNNSEIPHA
jgi:nicotinamidase/pyrazinamidase